MSLTSPVIVKNSRELEWELELKLRGFGTLTENYSWYPYLKF